jgi:hypothetical protein
VDGFEQIGLHELDAIGDVMTPGVAGGDGQRGGRDVDGNNPRVREFSCQRDGEAAAAGADVDEAPRAIAIEAAVADRLDDELGFGARDEDRGGDLEVERPEFLAAGDEGYRLAARAPRDERGETVVEPRRREAAAVREQPRPVPPERVAGEDFGVECGRLPRETGAGQRLARFEDAIVNRQCDGSDWKCATA